MQLVLESNNPQDYLQEIAPYIVFSTPTIQKQINEIKARASTNYDRAKMAFEIARDQIKHSFDTGNPVVTISAEDTLCQHEGICFAKAHLLAALLRGMGIPAGFCYQRVLRKGTIESGYALHGLNVVYLEGIGWFRVDPRGNKAGIDAQFNAQEEQLAYPIRTELGEVDYPNVFTAPITSVITAMETSATSQALFFNRPESL